MGCMKKLATRRDERSRRFCGAVLELPVAAPEAPDAWAENADKLAVALEPLLNRTDACGGYRGSRVTTRKDTDGDWLPMKSALHCHFAGHRTIGLHSTSPGNICRWLAFDIDAHDGESEEANLGLARTIVRRLRDHGLYPYVFDSDGRGGIHIWAILPSPMPASEAHELARGAGRDTGAECFPKQPQIREGGFGNWIRLPGHHPKQNHWSRVLTNDGWGDDEETVDALLELCSCC